MAKRSTPAGGANPPAAPAKTAILATLPEMVPTQQDGIKLLDFFNGLVKFSQRAMMLETRAKETLLAAKALQPPATAEEDAAIQTFIKRASADEKEVDDAWQITKIISGFHKRLTAARSRATAPLEESKQIAQKLHNRYVEDARRKAALETERLRLLEESRAAAARQKDIDALEEIALKAEKSSPDLSAREAVFVDAMMIHGNAVTAARQAKYQQPDNQAARLMTSPKILAALEARRTAAAARQQATAVAEQPLETEHVEVKPDVVKAGSDRTRHKAEVVDEAALIEAVIKGLVPRDILMVNGPKVNDYARSLQKNIERWPGVRYTPDTRTV